MKRHNPFAGLRPQGCLRCAGRRSGTGGFTLLELMVVMSLMSLVMLAMNSALRTMAQTESRVDARVTRTDELRSSIDFLRGCLGRAALRKGPTGVEFGVSPNLFQGQSSGMAWVGIMPARFGAGGRYFFRLAAEPAGRGSALVLRFAPWSPTAGFPDWGQTQARVLTENLSAFSMSYEDVRNAPGRWWPDWSLVPDLPPPERLDQLPARVRIQVRTADEAWPELIIPLRVLPATARGSGGDFTIGGSVD